MILFKKSVAVSVSLLVGIWGYAQERRDIGIITGANYYLGDYNPSTQLNAPQPALGIMLRYNLSNYYTLRASGQYGGVQGSHIGDRYLPGSTPTSTFQKRLVAFELMGEVGFLPFDTRKNTGENISPYIGLGLGIALVDLTFIPHIPMAIGVKFTPGGRWALGLEWRLHKTFFDSIDNYSNLSVGRKAWTHNNDWYGFGGLFVTYRLENSKAICPAYK